MNPAISVLTCPKRTQYLAATLKSLDEAGAARYCRSSVVFSDGPLPESVSTCGWELDQDEDGPRGPRAAMWRVFREMRDRGADPLIYCEDDILATPRAIPKMLEARIKPDQALLSFWDSKELPGAARGPRGVHNVPIMGRDRRGLFGACCLLIPARTLDWLVKHPHDGWGDPWEGDPDPADLLLGWSLRGSPWPYRGVHVPSLVEHVGDVSSLGHRTGQRAFLVDAE